MIRTNGYIDVSEATIKPISTEELAKIRRAQGAHIISHNGCFWEEITRYFYQPVHLLARLNIEAVPPAQFRWGYRAVLSDNDASKANGTIPVHLLTNLEDHDTHLLSSNRRHHLRMCRKKVKIVVLTQQDILREHGYDVVASSLKRTKHEKVPTFDSYIMSSDVTNFNNHLVLAGLVDGKLGGYLSGYAVNNTAYFASLFCEN